MITAYISIGLNNGQKVVYVRNEVNDTYGKNEQFYGYGGNGFNEVTFTDKKLGFFKIKRDQTYTFSLTIDGGSPTAYSIYIPKTKEETYNVYRSRLEKENIENYIMEYEFLNIIRGATKADGVEWYTTFKSSLVCKSTSASSGSSVVITDGTLFAALGGTIQSPVAGDALADQNTAAGEVLYDYNELLTDLQDTTTMLLEFPDSSPTYNLTRKNNSDDKSKDTKIVTTVPKSAVSEITIVEKYVSDYKHLPL